MGNTQDNTIYRNTSAWGGTHQNMLCLYMIHRPPTPPTTRPCLAHQINWQWLPSVENDY